MAKAREITGLDCSKRSLAWVQKVLLTRFDEMAEFRHAATGFAEIKGVHDMRVAARRLRSALRDIGPFLAKEPLKEIKKELKTISDALGEVRDRDVAIGALKKMSDEARGAEVKTGLAKLIEENIDARNLARLELTSAINSGDIDDLSKRFAAAIKEAARYADKISFENAGSNIVAQNLDEMLDLAPRLYKPFKQKGLHDLRIAAKRLRYSLELFALCGAAEAKPLAKEISKMQTALGDVHDCDLWIEDLGTRLQNEDNEDVRKAAAHLLPDFVKTRSKHYLSALAIGEDWQKNNLARRVREVISLA